MAYLKIFRNQRNSVALVLHDFKFSHCKDRLKIQNTEDIFIFKPLALHNEKRMRDKTDHINMY